MKVPNHDELAGIDNAKQSLCMIKSLLTEKQNEEEIEQRRELKVTFQDKRSYPDYVAYLLVSYV
jgi:hypothetical protein